jgi:spermidine synthase
VDEGEGNRFRSTNGKVDASSKMDMPTQVLLGQIPAAVAPNAEEVLVIGFASGTTVGSILLHPAPRVLRVTAVEIEPAVIEASRFFEDVNHRPLDDPRLEVVVEDARNHLAVTRRSFDLIVSEPSNPWMTVASNLFTREFYATARARLKPGGCFCQWLQIYALRPEDVKSIAATFLSVFPCTYAFFSEEGVDLMLVGSADPFRMDAEALRRRTGSPRVAEDLDSVGVDGVESLLSRFLGGPEELAAFAAGAGLNTDDDARIEFSSPRTLTVNLGSRIQAELLEHFRGISPYLDSIGATAEERADFVAEVAYASWHDEGLDRITRGLARDALSLAPPDGDAAERARTLLGQIEEE